MTSPFFTPTEASKQLGIQTSKLRKYISYFPELFSESARRERDYRYSQADLEVFKRVQEFGGKVTLLPATLTSRVAPSSTMPGSKPTVEPALLASLVTQLRALQEQVVVLGNLSRQEWSQLSLRQDQLSERQAMLLARLDRIAASLEQGSSTPLEYRRKPTASRWHWKRHCRYYPKRGQFVTTTSHPHDQLLCSICRSHEDAE